MSTEVYCTECGVQVRGIKCKSCGETIRLNAEQQQLVNDNLGLTWWAYHREKRRNALIRRMDEDDAVQAGQIGLCLAAIRFRPERGYRFSTYAGWWIRQALQKAALRVTMVKLAHSGSAKKTSKRYLKEREQALAPTLRIQVKDSEGTEFDYLGTEDRDPSVRIDILAAIAKIERRWAYVIVQAVFRGKSFVEIGKKMGLSRERVRQMHDKGMVKLRVLMGAVPRGG